MSQRIYMIYPGHQLATVDVAEGLHRGFLALGCTVEIQDLGRRASWYAGIIEGAGAGLDDSKLQEAAFCLASEEAIARIVRFEPDAVVIVHGGLIHGVTWEAIGKLRALFQVHLILTECPYEDETFAHAASLSTVVWANDKLSASQHGWLYLPAAYDEVVHRPPTDAIGGCPDVLFVGTGWAERIEFLSQVDWGGAWVRIIGPAITWAGAAGTPLERYVEDGSLPCAALWAHYAGSGAVLNFHRTSKDHTGAKRIVEAWSLNPRCYQVPACGGLLLSDWRPEFDDVFGACLPTFDSPRELGKLCTYYLDNPAAREDAIRASMDAVKPHTYKARAARVLEELHT